MGMYREKEEAPAEITLNMVKALQRTLHAYNVEWSRELVVKMFPQNPIDKVKDPKNKTGLAKLYNIGSGQIRNNAARVSFMIHGYELLRKYKALQKQALKVADEVSS